MLESLEVEMVIHCGDVGSPEIPPLFAHWPTHFVLGNVDKPGDDIVLAIEQAGLVCHGRFGSLTVSERSIAFLHSDDLRRFRETVDCGDWDLVCYGHTHRADQQTVGSTLVLNPGAISRARPATLAMVDLRRMTSYVMEIG
jgi:putative phosphoesterase